MPLSASLNDKLIYGFRTIGVFIWMIALKALHEALGTSGILIYLILCR
jgi:hypothetical protein